MSRLKKRKLGAAALIVLSLQLALAGCSQGSSQNSVVKKNGGTQTTQLIPGANSKDYQSLRPVSNDQMRGYINYGVNNRVDVDQLELGLMNMSKSVFSPDQYVFQSGQYLTENDINGMLYRQGQEKNKTSGSLPGLNPPLGTGKTAVQRAQSSPKYLNYVLEQDYLKKSSNGKYVLAGVSIAVSLNSVYSDQIMDQNQNINSIQEQLNSATVKAWGRSVAPKILQRVRSVKGLSKVPVFLTLYMTAAPDSLIPGDYFAKTTVSAGSTTIDKWTTVNDQHVLFPSTAASSQYKADLAKFNTFKSDVQKYYPDFVGVVGKGFYENQTLTDLTIDINLRFMDETEIIGFTNYVASIVNNGFGFGREVPIHISITSNDVQEALVDRTSSMDTAYVHIFQH
ncbi:CamS family sex pheromone protein [Sporolactobacillus sp. CQH2019]|uniref:CamS family sex pheromone protein n=1 Tax=Sporolactobacillus sp. CQH2019 TaxID=3023512 RepID=UPI00236893AB|nr:CamS family sex pheromone protein [Sporolactobacillus sp. CQH2019]MDD9149739.1 CamS family sex pheromone protein [Sporolactobacillus sp. CQH2019]